MLKQQTKIHREPTVFVFFFVAELLHKVAAASRLPNIA